MHNLKVKTLLQGYIKETVLLPAGSRNAEGSDLHRGSHHKRSFRRIADRKLLMHETTVHDRLVLQHNLIAVAALQSLLISVTFMGAVLHLLEIPYHTKFSHRYNNVTFLFPILRDLRTPISASDNMVDWFVLDILARMSSNSAYNAPSNMVDMHF